MHWIQIASIILAAIAFISLFISSLYSLKEKEIRAARLFLVFMLAVPVFLLIPLDLETGILLAVWGGMASGVPGGVPVSCQRYGFGRTGTHGILMTPELGPRVRIGVVTTDVPLEITGSRDEPSMIDFCLLCKKCADICPANAISFDEPAEINRITRWQINQEACFTLWTKIGTDCGRFVSVCPCSHPDNLMHNLVRQGLRR